VEGAGLAGADAEKDGGLGLRFFVLESDVLAFEAVLEQALDLGEDGGLGGDGGLALLCQLTRVLDLCDLDPLCDLLRSEDAAAGLRDGVEEGGDAGVGDL
jgi:hypothetical protein